MQILFQVRQYILFLQPTKIAILILFNQRFGKRYSSSDNQTALPIFFTFRTSTIRRLRACQHDKSTDQRFLRMPSIGIGGEGAEKDVDAVGLAEDMFGGADVGYVVGVGTCIRRNGRRWRGVCGWKMGTTS